METNQKKIIAKNVKQFLTLVLIAFLINGFVYLLVVVSSRANAIWLYPYIHVYIYI